MANRTLEWMIRLIDQVSAPAKQADSALGKVQRQVEALKKEAAGGNAGLDKMVKSVESATGAKTAGVAGRIRKLVGAGGEGAGKEFGSEFGGELTKLLKGVVGNEAGEALSGIFGKVLGGTGTEIAGMATGIGAVVAGAMVLLDIFKEVARAIVEAVTKLAEMTVEMSKFAIETAAFKESSLISMGTVLGSDSAARKLFDRTVRLSAKLPIGTKEALDLTNRFAVGGFKGSDTLRKLTIAASDVGAMRGHEGVESFISQLVDINSIGLQMGHLNTLARGSGIRTSLIFDQLRKLTGKAGTDHDMEELIAKGSIGRDVAIKAIIQALAVQEHGPLGTLSVRSAKTFEGLLTRLKSVGFNMFLDFNKSKGFGAAKGAFGNLVDLLSPTSATGRAIQGALKKGIGGIVQTVFGGLAGAGGKTALKSFLGQVPGLVTHVTKIFEKVIAGVKGFLGGFVTVVGPFVKQLLSIVAFGSTDGALGFFHFLGVLAGIAMDVFVEMASFVALLLKPYEFLFDVLEKVSKWEDRLARLIRHLGKEAWDEMVGDTSKPSSVVHNSSADKDSVGALLHSINHSTTIHIYGDVNDPDRLVRRLNESNRGGMHGYFLTSSASQGAF